MLHRVLHCFGFLIFFFIQITSHLPIFTNSLQDENTFHHSCYRFPRLSRTLHGYNCFMLLVPVCGRILKFEYLLSVVQYTLLAADSLSSVFLKVVLQLKFVVIDSGLFSVLFLYQILPSVPRTASQQQRGRGMCGYELAWCSACASASVGNL